MKTTDFGEPPLGSSLEQLSLIEMQAQALLYRFLGLGDREQFKDAGRALEAMYVAVVRALEPEVIVEVGAHEARFSCAVRRILKQTPIIAFEANPHVFAEYAPILTAQNIDYRNMAISDAPGTLRFKVPIVRGEPATRTGSLKTSALFHDYAEYDVPAARLDDFGFGTSVLWIDVEGANEEVFAGAEEMLKSCQAILIEVETDERWPGQWVAADVIAYLARRGFVAIARDVQRSWQFNMILVRRELMLDHRVAPFRDRFFTRLRGIAGLIPPSPPSEPETA